MIRFLDQRPHRFHDAHHIGAYWMSANEWWIAVVDTELPLGLGGTSVQWKDDVTVFITVDGRNDNVHLFELTAFKLKVTTRRT